MQFRACVSGLFVILVIGTLVDGKKTFSSRRKSGNSRRGSSSSSQPRPPSPQPSTTNHKTDTNTNFLNSERAGSSHGSGSVNTHYRQTPFNNKPAENPRPSAPQTNGPIGFDKVNSEVQHKHATQNVPSAPSYPSGSPPYPSGGATYPGRPASPPNGPPPAYPGLQSPGIGFDSPPAYPGRPVNAPPIYPANGPKGSGYHPGQSYPDQSHFGYPNSGGNNFGQSYPQSNPLNSFGSQPIQGFGSYPNGGFGSYGQQFSSGYNGRPFGGSPFGQPHYSGGAPFSSSGFGGTSFGGYGNSHYTPNNFGFSNNPGLFGSHSGYSGNNLFGTHKKSRFGGLPIPIPIPIPIPLGGFGGFGGFGGHSHNHRLLDSFVKNKNITASNNDSTSVFIINNSTVTPCTTDQFIYNSLNITVMSCTAGNCSAVKVIVTSNVSSEVKTHSAGLTMCREPHTTFSSFGDNVNPTVSDVHEYRMRAFREEVTINGTNQSGDDVTVKNSTETVNNISESNFTKSEDQNATTSQNSTSVDVLPNTTVSSLESNTTIANTSQTTINTSFVLYNCSWMEMCVPPVEIKDVCSVSDICPQVRTTYRPCIRINMCQSPFAPLSTLATFNNTISQYDQFNNISTFNDVANLTLISYMASTSPIKCLTDTSPTNPHLTQENNGCTPSYSSLTTEGAITTPKNDPLSDKVSI